MNTIYLINIYIYINSRFPKNNSSQIGLLMVLQHGVVKRRKLLTHMQDMSDLVASVCQREGANKFDKVVAFAVVMDVGRACGAAFCNLLQLVRKLATPQVSFGDCGDCSFAFYCG